MVDPLQNTPPTGEEPTVLSEASSAAPDAGSAPRLAPGQRFGPYRIGRELGRGGMGEVYEAEHLEHGRRVAIKVLNQGLADARDRERFLREGRLAASINHPNTVYIYGSEEIDDTPVIAMELLTSGTLKDRVRDKGPLPPAEAVDGILQIAAGLDAAQAAGVLHRDIKPANCFVDRDGTAKVGDFGLSISTLARDVTQLTTVGTFQGTPQFAPPEQLKGEPLDLRADIYALGATLYYLLTGRPPFDTTELMALLTRVATEPPQSPRELAPHVPRGLAAVVLQCLAKQPAGRPASYAVLAEALRPFSSEAATPATIGLRMLAAVIDWAVVSLPFALGSLPISFQAEPRFGLMQVLTLVSISAVVVYFGMVEGIWGRSVGKRLCGLRVRRTDGQQPGLARAFARAAMYEFPVAVQAVPALILGFEQVYEWQLRSSLQSLVFPASMFGLLALLFVTARRRNGFAGLHDLATDTRVVRDTEVGTSAVRRPGTDGASKDNADLPAAFGPFEVTSRLGPSGDGHLYQGFDPTLRRRVWIHTQPIGSDAVAAERREVGRPGRLRWLGGRRAPEEVWDAYEAPDGWPLQVLVGAGSAGGGHGQPAPVVAGWLADLASEFNASLSEGSMPPVGSGRVWVTSEGRAKLLDFNAPGMQSPSDDQPATPESAQAFLAGVGTQALGEERPLALSARSAIDTLARGGFGSLRDAATELGSLRQQPDRVTRTRRVLSLGPSWIVPLAVVAFFTVAMFFMQRVFDADMQVMLETLGEIDEREEQIVAGESSPEIDAEVRALEMYLVGRFGPTLADPSIWQDPFMAGLLRNYRTFAERAMANHPDLSIADLDGVRSDFPELVEDIEDTSQFNPLLVGPIIGAIVVVLMAIGGIVTAVALRGGLALRLCRIAVVDGTGQEAARWRTFLRGVVTWLPVGVGVLLLRVSVPAAAMVFGVLAVAGTVWALTRPERGFQDRLVGTWLVPR
jgi:uncharacterized RDD family membrane protein YckC